jgi:hypothetical protein
MRGSSEKSPTGMEALEADASCTLRWIRSSKECHKVNSKSLRDSDGALGVSVARAYEIFTRATAEIKDTGLDLRLITKCSGMNGRFFSCDLLFLQNCSFSMIPRDENMRRVDWVSGSTGDVVQSIAGGGQDDGRGADIQQKVSAVGRQKEKVVWMACHCLSSVTISTGSQPCVSLWVLRFLVI